MHVRALRVVVSIKGAIHAERFAPWCCIDIVLHYIELATL